MGDDTRKQNRSLTRSLIVMAAASFAFGFALIPLYKVICEAAGLKVNDRPSTIRASEAAAGRRVTLEFISMLAPGSDFELVPETREMTLQPGRLYAAKFRIRSLSMQPVVGQAIPRVAPAASARYLQKTECFCFTPQSFAAAQEREFTVRFIIDPSLPARVDRMTLAYSMYVVPQRKLAAL